MLLQGDSKVTELLADPSAKLTLLAPTNAGLAIEQLSDPSTVRPFPLDQPTCHPNPVCMVVVARCSCLLHLAP